MKREELTLPHDTFSHFHQVDEFDFALNDKRIDKSPPPSPCKEAQTILHHRRPQPHRHPILWSNSSPLRNDYNPWPSKRTAPLKPIETFCECYCVGIYARLLERVECNSATSVRKWGHHALLLLFLFVEFVGGRQI